MFCNMLPAACWCRKPTSVVKMPEQAQSAVQGLIMQYFVGLQQARFKDNHIWMKLMAVGHMLAEPATLFAPDVAGRLLWFLLTEKLKFAPTKASAHGITAAGEAAGTVAVSQNKS